MTENKSNMFIPLTRPMSLQEIAFAAGGRLLLSDEQLIRSITTDSRDVEKGSLFVAIKGERLDGHRFISKAFEGGAACVLCSDLPDTGDVKCGNLIQAADTVRALGAIAAAHKEEIEPLTVAVTGSVGKTTTKEFIYAVLSSRYYTHKTSGNFNNEIGLPVVLLKLTSEHKALVLEMGMSFRGEISRLTRIARPDIAVITNIGSSHIENLGSREGIRDAKLEIREGLKPGGKLILSGDEDLLAGISGALYVSLANSKGADIRVTGIRETSVAGYETSTRFDLETPDGSVRDIGIPTIGAHNVFDAAFAYAVGREAGLSEDGIRSGLENFRNTGMRQNIYVRGGVTIIEDCYNASPESMAASLKVLKSVSEKQSGKSVAVLGDMRELGEYSPELHEKVGDRVVGEGVDMLVTFGREASKIADGAERCGMDQSNIIRLEDLSRPELAYETLCEILNPGDTVLFKASRAVELERVVKLLAPSDGEKTVDAPDFSGADKN